MESTISNVGQVLNPKLLANLAKLGITSFFPVQQDVIPLLIAQNSNPTTIPRDIYVTAPTGSGKTLAYVLPVLHCLLLETVQHLRCLILLPNRELALQVHQVVTSLIIDTGICVALTIGASSFEEEQMALTNCQQKANNTKNYNNLLSSSLQNVTEPRCCIDLMITTPGRLLDHLQFTKGFTLEHVRFLVMDEADRLLGNAYHGWVRTLLASTESVRSSHYNTDNNHNNNDKRRRLDNRYSCSTTSSTVHRLPLQRLLFSATGSDDPTALSLLGMINPLFIRSATVSSKQRRQKEDAIAAFTHEEENGEVDDEDDDEYVLDDHEVFTLPESLIEKQLKVKTNDKLLKLVALLVEAIHFPPQKPSASPSTSSLSVGNNRSAIEHHGICNRRGNNNSNMCVIFVSSIDASHRLSTLLQLINQQLSHAIAATAMIQKEYPSFLESLHALFAAAEIVEKPPQYLFHGRVEEMTRTVKPSERQRILKDAAQGQVAILVSSDRMARGMDLPNLSLVINYEVPKQSRSYVHRAGRTARAGRMGMCLTIVKKGQEGEMKQLLKDVVRTINKAEQDSSIERKTETVHLSKETLQAVESIYQAAVNCLPQFLDTGN